MTKGSFFELPFVFMTILIYLREFFLKLPRIEFFR